MKKRVTVDADSLRSEIRDRSVRVIDVRKSTEYEQDHIPSAVSLPLARLLSDDRPESVQTIFGSLGVDDETPVVIYDDTFGALASRVAWALEHIGHGDVSLLDTTYSNWRSLGLETDRSVPDVQTRNHSVDLRHEIFASAEYLEKAGEQNNILLVDNRERLNYLEHHIPGAINIPYRALASPGKIIRPGREIYKMLENRGASDKGEIITYCGSVGTLSGLAYYALRSAGLENIRLYVRSFREWRNLGKPVVKQRDANYWDLSAE